MTQDWHNLTGRARDWAIAQVFGWTFKEDWTWDTDDGHGGDEYYSAYIYSPKDEYGCREPHYAPCDPSISSPEVEAWSHWPFPHYPADNAVVERMIRDGIADPKDLTND